MADSKRSSTSKKKSDTTESSHGLKSSDKKEESFFARTAHSIRDKVHGLTDEIKEKTHHKSQGNDSKKSKKQNDIKKSPSPHITTVSHEDHKRSDSEDEEYDKPSPPIPSSTKNNNTLYPNKSTNSLSKSSSAASSRSSSPQPSTTTSGFSKSASGSKLGTANAMTSNTTTLTKSGNESTSKLSPNNSSQLRKSNERVSMTEGNNSSKPNNTTDRVHLSFDGIVTVDDLLNRIDETFENAKLIIGKGKERGSVGVNLQQTENPSKTNLINTERKSRDQNSQNVLNPWSKGQNQEDEPIRLNYSEIHTLDDILVKVNGQPGNRRVILENVPNNTNTNPSKNLTTNTALSAPSENKDLLQGPKSILKSSPDPSSADTSTKVAAVDDNQIHIDISGVQKLDDLLDRIDETVEKVPLIIETKPSDPKRESSATQLTAANPSPRKNSSSNQGEKSPRKTRNSASHPDASKGKDETVPEFHIPEHEFGKDEKPGRNSQSRTIVSSKKKESEEVEWI